MLMACYIVSDSAAIHRSTQMKLCTSAGFATFCFGLHCLNAYDDLYIDTNFLLVLRKLGLLYDISKFSYLLIHSFETNNKVKFYY